MARKTHTLNRLALVVATALVSTIAAIAPARAEMGLTPHIAEYKVKILFLGGKLTTKLTSTEDGFRAERITTPTGMARLIKSGTIEETSVFAMASDGVRPSSYYSNDQISKKAGETRISFDWTTNEVNASHNDLEVAEVLEDLSHDRLSIQYELMYDMLNDLPTDSYVIFEVDKLRPLRVERIGEKTVKVPAGEFNVVGIRHQAEGSSRATTFWCAAELGYLPVVIERHRKGKLQMRAQLRNYTPL